MEKNLTELVFIVDRSGSMGGLEDDTIGGFNAMLKDQQDIEGDAIVTTVLFDDKYELLHDRINIKGVAPLTKKDYTVRGYTALLDAIGITINKIHSVQENTNSEYRADKVMFVIITDGHENSSCEYTAEQVKERIKHQKEKYGWEFIFLGANMDAVAEAAKYGISPDRASNYYATPAGIIGAWGAISVASSEYRVGSEIKNLEKEIKESRGY